LRPKLLPSSSQLAEQAGPSVRCNKNDEESIATAFKKKELILFRLIITRIGMSP